MDENERLSKIAELEKERKELRGKLHELSAEIYQLKRKDYWQNYYTKYEKKRIKSPTKCETMMGKKYTELNPDELRKYNALKQAERRQRLKTQT